MSSITRWACYDNKVMWSSTEPNKTITVNHVTKNTCHVENKSIINRRENIWLQPFFKKRFYWHIKNLQK